MSDKAAMSREIPHLRGLLASKSKRIGQLEYMVGETKEIASSEYEKLRAENEQMKANFMAKLKDKERDSQYSSVPRRYRHAVDHGSGGLVSGTDPVTGLMQTGGGRRPHSVDHVTGLSMLEPRAATKRPGGPTFVRPVPRRGSSESVSSSSRERLMAGAGVSLIGQRPKPSQLSTVSESGAPTGGPRRTSLPNRH